MDPLSITTACGSLRDAIAKTSLQVTTFVRAVRSARNDLDGVLRELTSLATSLELISEDAEDIETFSDTLLRYITGILANCKLVFVEVQRLIAKHGERSGVDVWASSEDVARLRLSLEAHNSALGIALEMVTFSISKQIRNDLVVLKFSHVAADPLDVEVKNGTEHPRDNATGTKQAGSKILQEIARLRAQLPNVQNTRAPLNRKPDSILARYLDELTSYAKTVCWSEDIDTSFVHEDILTSTYPKLTQPDLSAKTSTSLTSSASISSNLSKSLYETPPKEHTSQSVATDLSPPLPTCTEPNPFVSAEDVEEILPSESSSKILSVATAPDLSQAEQQINEHTVPGQPAAFNCANSPKAPLELEHVVTSSEAGVQMRSVSHDLNGASGLSNPEIPTTSINIYHDQPCNTIPTDPQEWTNFGPLQSSAGESLTLHQNDRTKELLVVRSHRIVDRCGHRLPRAEIYGLLKHPHLASLRYVGRTSECWLLYMDLTDSTTALTHFISTYHHSLGLGPTLELVDPDWWESWICEMARQIGSALRYCFLHSISYGALRTDDVLVTDTGNIKLVGFDLIDMENMTHDKEAFTTFTYGTVIWHMACGTPPWPEKDNLERYAHPRSSVLTRPSYMSSQCFSILAGLLGNPMLPGISRLLPLHEALSHPWMNRMCPQHLPDYVPQRAPLFAPFDVSILRHLKAMGLGDENVVQRKLGSIVNSSEYKTAIKVWTRDQERIASPSSQPGIRKSFMLALSERRRAEYAKQGNSKFPGGFYEVLCMHTASPLLAMYYLVKEKLERDRGHTSKIQALEISDRPVYRYC